MPKRDKLSIVKQLFVISHDSVDLLGSPSTGFAVFPRERWLGWTGYGGLVHLAVNAGSAGVLQFSSKWPLTLP